MRYRVLKELGYKEAICKVIPQEATAEQLRAVTIKDNNSFGDWDFDLLANDWEIEELDKWGIDLPPMDEEEDNGSDESEADNAITVTAKSDNRDMMLALFTELQGRGFDCKLSGGGEQ